MKEESRTIPTIAEQIAIATCVFHEQRTGRMPTSANVVINGDTLVVTLMGALSPAEKLLASNPERAATVQEFHHQLFHSASATIRSEIERMTKVEVKDANVQVLITGIMVQVFVLAQVLAIESWSGGCSAAAVQSD